MSDKSRRFQIGDIVKYKDHDLIAMIVGAEVSHGFPFFNILYLRCPNTRLIGHTDAYTIGYIEEYYQIIYPVKTTNKE